MFIDEVSSQDLKDITSEFIRFEKEQGINRFLVNATGINITASLMDIYYLPNRQYIEEDADRDGRVALILPTDKKQKEYVQFYETVCVNRGWDVKAFKQRQPALEWLLADQ
ncbi:MAG: hypothetical protein QNJ69_15025 [Gammaproteobacteria bacterium]|nr:hypothetical protein [Gammaproteobacteria bacterium]